jgi:trehalose 6-phosphate synthase/phosphatase
MAQGESREEDYRRRERNGEHGEPNCDDNEYRMLIVGHMLPLIATRSTDDQGWIFSWDEDSLLLQLKAGLPREMEVIYIGCLKVDVGTAEQDEVAATLLENFNCVPAFLPLDVRTRYYHGFCKQTLWPLFHYMMPLSPEHGGRFNRSFWQAYVSVNKIFADKVMEVISPDDDYVWIHDYHLMVLPTFLRKRFNKVRLGYFLHTPFPSSEIYRTLPMRDEILRALLNADLIGFHTFDYARHFLSCCSRMLGLAYESKRGYIGLEYYGRTVGIKILPVGIHMGQLRVGLQLPDTKWRIGELQAQFEGKTVLLGMDDMDIFKGIGLKLLALEQLLSQHSIWRGRVVLVQIANPARGRGKDVEELQNEAYGIAQRINDRFGSEGYNPVVLVERHVPFHERIAYYTVADCCVVTAVRDGMNLIPYEYIACREGGSQWDAHIVPNPETPKKSMLIVSEFIGCSPSLSGAIRVNPWNIEAVAEAMNLAITLPDSEQHMRHEKHFRFVSTHDVAYWARSFMGDLQRTCKGHARRRCYGIGFGMGFRVVALDPDFRRLRTDLIVSAYKKSSNRAILLDYDGTMIPQVSINNPTPSSEVLSVLNTLCSDPKNFVVIVSGRGRNILDDCFASCERLGLAAEHGYFYRWHRDAEWVRCRWQREDWDASVVNFEWKQVVEPLMEQYTESTDGSYIEWKESAMVWHHRDADPDFGSWQAKELLDHLESVLANQPVTVKSGAHIVEVKPQVIFYTHTFIIWTSL